MIDGQPKARVTRDKLDRLLAQARQAAARRTPDERPDQDLRAARRAALAVDADAVARAIEVAAEQRGLAVQLVRNGSRGLLWLEPMVEIATPAGRVAYGPVQPEDVAGLFEAGWLQGDAHPLRLGPTEDIPYLKHQERLTFARVGVTDPLSLQDYAAHGGLEDSSAHCPWRPGHRPGTHRFRTARPWRRGLPHRHQMEDGGRHAGRPEIHRL